MSDSTNDVDRMLTRLLAAQRLCITTHIRPDGDALGSQIALGLFLRKLGKQVLMINHDSPPRNLEWMMELGEVKTFTGALKQLHAFAEAGAVVMVDTNSAERVGDIAKPFRNASGEKLLIDHHPSPETWFDTSYVDTTAAAAGEMIYKLIVAHDADLIDEPIATALYAAIMTDTGSFRYGSTTAETHRIIADLLERGAITPEPIHIAINDTWQIGRLRLLARAIDTITPVYDGRLAYVVVTLDMLNSTDTRSDAAEGIVNYPLSIDGVEAVVMFLETPSGVKCSFRSKGDLAINGWARRFGGGGHQNAAGAFLRDRAMRAAIDEVITAAPTHLDLGDEYEVSDELSEEDLSLLARFQGKI